MKVRHGTREPAYVWRWAHGGGVPPTAALGSSGLLHAVRWQAAGFLKHPANVSAETRRLDHHAAKASAAAWCLSIHWRTSPTRQAVMPADSRSGCGNVSAFT